MQVKPISLSLSLSLSYLSFPEVLLTWGNKVIGTYWIIGSVVLILEGLLRLLELCSYLLNHCWALVS